LDHLALSCSSLLRGAVWGGGSVLLRKERSYAEVYNDMDGEVVNVFRVVREQGPELIRSIALTPFSREDYKEAWFPAQDAMEQARRTLVRAFMGFGSAAVSMQRHPPRSGRGVGCATGFRSNSNRSGTTPAHDWMNFPEGLRLIVERLRGVVIENKDAKKVMLQHDSPKTLHYVDPPYLFSSRTDHRADYRHEMDEDDHIELAKFLYGLKGAVVLSSYPNELYAKLFKGWKRVEKQTHADGARKRTEVLWIKP
jgi:DNA adenine methylase